MEKMPPQNMPVQRLKTAVLPFDLPCSGLITHSGDISMTGKSHKKKSRCASLTRKSQDVSPKDNMEMKKVP
jgi:hypothetical protein